MRNSLLLTGTLLATPAIVHTSAYANTLTGLIPTLYAAMDTVSRELVGFLPSVARDSNAEQAAVGQDVTYNIAPTMTGYDIVPAMNVPEPPDFAVETGIIKITKARAIPFGWTGEEQRALNNGVGVNVVQAGLFAQGLRTLVNDMEADIAAEAVNASRAYGTPGTPPFQTDLSASAQVRKILDDNGAPASDRSMVINTAAGAQLRTLANLTRANENGSDMTLRDGVLLDVHGFAIKESAKVVEFIKGTAAAATTNNAGYAVGSRTITLASAGTGTIKAGDTVQFAGDTNKYVVASGDASTADGGTITLQRPGLRVAIPAAATAITLGASASYNLAFQRDAIQLVTRAPALPNEGDLAIDRMTITDPRSGMAFEVSIYPGYRKVRAEVAAVWGTKAVKPEHMAILLG